MNKPWLRLYSNIIDNHKIIMLAFEDRWHYVALLALKRTGLLDANYERSKLHRKISLKLGVSIQNLDEIKRRLIEEKLIDDHFQPLGWPDKQFESDSSTKRVQEFRNRQKSNKEQEDNSKKHKCNVSVTSQDTDTDTDTDITSTVVDNFFKYKDYYWNESLFSKPDINKALTSIKKSNLSLQAVQQVIDEATGQALSPNNTIRKPIALLLKLIQLAISDSCKITHFSQSIAETRTSLLKEQSKIQSKISSVTRELPYVKSGISK